MDIATSNKYSRCLDHILAQEQLRSIRSNSFSNLEKRARKNEHKRLIKLANPFAVKKALTKEEVDAYFNKE